MKKYLLLALIISSLFASAQNTSGYCKAQFKYRVNDILMSPVASTAINFDDRSEGNITVWFWDFGDGTTSSEQNPFHVFNHPIGGPTVKMSPYRTISLTILTSDSCKSQYSEMINIMDGTTYIADPDTTVFPPVDPPVYPPLECSARYKYYQTEIDSVTGKVTFQFNNYSEGDSLSYSWFFDYAGTSIEKEPLVTFDMKQLPIKASLTVNGKNGCSNTFWDAVYLDIPIIDPPIYFDSTKCYVVYGYTPNFTVKIFAPALVLDFYPKTSPEAIKWNWDFGDGTTSEEQYPMHIFNLPLANSDGSTDQVPYRKVCLTATTANGCIETYCESIDLYMNVTPPVDPVPQCHAWIKYYRPSDIVTIPELIPYQFIDASEGDVVSRLWQFEDGTTSTEAMPLVNFDFMKTMQKVSLTIYTSDSCSSTWSEIIYLRDNYIDSSYVSKPVWSYQILVTGKFPIEMSSCAGTAHAQVYMNDSIVEADYYTWSTGEMGQDVKGLCPTQTYSVKAITADGNYVSSTFIFNSDGTLMEIPTAWYLTGGRDDQQIKYNLENKDFTVEWHLCDGTIAYGDSIPLNSINCGGNEANVVLKDAAGNVVYTENISLKTLATKIKPNQQVSASVKLYPNPVKDVLNIKYAGKMLNEMQIEICDIAGRSISSQKVYDVEPGQNISLNVNSLRNGIYLCKMVSGKQVIGIEKFVK